MKALIYLPLILFISSCSTQPVEVADNRIEITPFIVNRVVLRDTALVKDIYHNLLGVDSAKVPIFCYDNLYAKTATYLNTVQFNQLSKGLQYMISNPKSKIYYFPDSAALSNERVRKLMLRCDSITESYFDKNGKEVLEKRLMCDSTSLLYEINRIDFFEAWYFNKETNIIEKEILGYSVLQFIDKRHAFRELFIVLKDEKAAEKARKYYFF